MEKLHVVLVPLPGQGHIPAMLYLARKLAVQGIIVTVINIDSIHATVKQTWKHIPGEEVRFESINFSSLPLDEKLVNNQAIFLDALVNLEEPLEKLIHHINQRGPKVRCVISDFWHYTAPYVAHKLGLTSACLFNGIAIWALAEYSLPQIIAHGDYPVRGGEKKRISYLPGVELTSEDLPLTLDESVFNQLGMENSLLRVRRLELDRWVLMHSVYELEPEVMGALETLLGRQQVVCIGPLFPLKAERAQRPEVSLRNEDMECLEWLDKQAFESVLYISFGSIAFLTMEQFSEIALGLVASQVPFLWVVRENSVLGMNNDVYRGFVESTKGKGMVISWAPQLQVLEHQSIGGFLTHSGWNSMFESLSRGVPMLCWPCMFDQNMNTKLMLDNGACIPFLKAYQRVVPKDEIEHKIKALMRGEEGLQVRKKTTELQKVVTEAVKPGGSSYLNFEKFVDEFLLV